MKTVAYLRVSTGSQDLATQKLAILDFTQKRRFTVDAFIESRIFLAKESDRAPHRGDAGNASERRSPAGQRVVAARPQPLSQVLQIVATLIERKIRFIAIKEAIEVEGKQDLRTKVMIAMFGLFAEVERDLISERTKEGLAAAKAKGKQLGRPKGALGKSKLDGKEQDIRMLLGKEVSKASIAKILDVSRSALIPLHRDAQDRARLTRKPAWDSPGLMLYFNTNLGATPDTSRLALYLRTSAEPAFLVPYFIFPQAIASKPFS